LTPNQIDRLKRLVTAKGWEAFDYLAHPDFRTIDAITRMLQELPSNEIDLSLDLLDDYLIIKNYVQAARELMLSLRECEGRRPILVTPLVDFQSERTKSGHALHYEMSTFTRFFGKGEILFRDDPKSTNSQNHVGIHICVDDYIGTGSQFLTMIENIEKDGKKSSITHIGTICIQESAKNTLEKLGYIIISSFVLGKGLDQLSLRRKSSKDQILAEYEALERKTRCPDRYCLGREKSEALVTMKATPNNTLPIFWIEGKHEWPAPFPRPRR
jgi:hypothetical protein